MTRTSGAALGDEPSIVAAIGSSTSPSVPTWRAVVPAAGRRAHRARRGRRAAVPSRVEAVRRRAGGVELGDGEQRRLVGRDRERRDRRRRPRARRAGSRPNRIRRQPAEERDRQPEPAERPRRRCTDRRPGVASTRPVGARRRGRSGSRRRRRSRPIASDRPVAADRLGCGDGATHRRRGAARRPARRPAALDGNLRDLRPDQPPDRRPRLSRAGDRARSASGGRRSSTSARAAPTSR